MRRRHDLGELGHDFRQGLPKDIGLGGADEPFGRTVEDADLAVMVDADDAGAGAGQDGFGETPPAVDHVARIDDVVVLGAQFMRHLVESLAELGEIALPAPIGTCT